MLSFPDNQGEHRYGEGNRQFDEADFFSRGKDFLTN